MKEKILKLLRSGNKDDLLIGLEFLRGKTKDEVIEYLGLNKVDFPTITEDYNSERIQGYRLSKDCLIIAGSALFIATNYSGYMNENVTDLR